MSRGVDVPSAPVAVARSLVPRPVRRLLRGVHRRIVFDRAMRRLIFDPPRAIADDTVLRDLVYGWGNEHWSALPEYLRYMATASTATRGNNTLECGSGLSTILLAAVASRTGGHVTALEHSPVWGERVSVALTKYGLTDHATVRVAPLRSFGDFWWYEPPPPDRMFALVVCDGPPGNTPGGRYGLLPVAGALLCAGCRILLDDATRPEEQAAVQRWQKETAATVRMHGIRKPFAELRLP